MKTTGQDGLNMWRGVLVESVRREGRDLSARQMAVLLSVYMTPAPHTVRGLAGELGVSKPVITRAVNALGRLGLVRRTEDPSDRRSVLIQCTVQGSAYLSDFAELIVRAGETASGPGGRASGKG